MKNYVMTGFAMLSILLFSGCGGQNKQNTKEMNENSTKTICAQVKLQKDSLLATLMLDEMKVIWIRDNASERLMPRSLFPDATDTLIDSLSLQNGVPASISTFLVESKGKQMLFDTGNGTPQGRMMEGLKSVNVNPEDIDYLFLTHFHGDHIGGMMKDGKAVFPKAEVYASKMEYDAWMKMPVDKRAQIEATMNAYKDHLHLFAFGDTLPENVLPMEAIGHTPGHTIYRVGKLLIIGDLFHGFALQKNHPEICAQYDMDKNEAIKSRKYYLKYARENRLIMAGMHLPVPAFAE